MTDREFALRRARAYWSTGRNLPTHLFNEFRLLGLDVDRERDTYMATIAD